MTVSPEQFAGDVGRPPGGSHASAKPGGGSHPLVIVAFLAAVVFAEGASWSWAQSVQTSAISREYAIKGAYLYQFGCYVQWPDEAFAGAESPFAIGVPGDDPFGVLLEEIAQSKKVGGRTIVIRRFASMADFVPCHILFVSSATNVSQQTEAIKRARSVPILLVGETPGFAAQGGTVNFYLEDNRIRFEINPETAKQQQLKISSKLLSLAKIVGAAGPDQSIWREAEPKAEAIVRLDAAGRRM